MAEARSDEAARSDDERACARRAGAARDFRLGASRLRPDARLRRRRGVYGRDLAAAQPILFRSPAAASWLAHFAALALGESPAMRLPFIALFAGASWLLFVLARNLFGARAGS